MRVAWSSPESTSAGAPAVASFLLGCNPSPMFAAIKRRTGAAPVTGALADLLTRRRRPTPACNPAA
jgi:hypothetical protein